MSEKPISPLRQRMLEDMSVRRFMPDTQREYIRAVKKLAAFLGRSPDTATAEELRAFQLHLTASGVQPPTINATVTALRFFFTVTLDRPETTRHLVFVYEPRKLPACFARGGATPAGGGARAQAQGGAQRRLRRRSARHGGGRAEGLRYRFQAHDASGGAGQGPQGSLCHAVAAAVGAAARLVAHCPPAGDGCFPAATASTR